ncbi:MAG TPA: hypothetical protein VK791_08925, partial [bacterium]|nr:hypothetical protein [bacterium]
TFTNTNTNTITDTPTTTNTPTNTFTFTSTNTNTDTPTFTNTTTDPFTPTMTNTPVPFATNTPTFTNTNTNTVTGSPTFTNTVTETFTNTATNTFTALDTLTFTNTATATNTNSYTMTVTRTSTNTFTNTVTMTQTNTSSATNTPTQTFTVTPTSTPTSFVAMGKAVSEGQVHPGDNLTYAIGITVAGNSLTGMIVTDTLPVGMTFVSFESYPGGTVTTFNSATDQLQWTLPSPLAPGVYDLTYETKLSISAASSAPLTNFAELNYPGASHPLTSSVPVTVIGNFTVTVNIYNSAGEIVKTISVQNVAAPIDNISLSTSNLITTLNGPGSSIEILYDGYVIGVWDGSNNEGQPVSNGSYRVQVDSKSPSGVVTSVAQNAVVNRSLANISANIYNSAGEMIRALYYSATDATGATMNDVVLSSGVIKPTASGSTSITTGIPAVARIAIQSSGSSVTMIWDGTNNSSSYVSPGIYTIDVHWNEGSGNSQVIKREIMVLPGYNASGIVVAKPNELNTSNGMNTIFDATSVMNAYFIQVQIYTLAGERLQTLTSSYGVPQVNWNATGVASGIYVAVVTIQNANGGTVGIQRLKVLVLH